MNHTKNIFIKSWSVLAYEDIENAQGEVKKNIRRLNYPVQASILSAYELISNVKSKDSVGLFSIAPYNNGSPEIFNWAKLISEKMNSEDTRQFSINPVHTLHVIDNLALSMLSIFFANKEYCIGFGGSCGQFWVALEKAVFLLSEGLLPEVLIFAGDVQDIDRPDSVMGAALYLSTSNEGDATQNKYRVGKINHSRYDTFQHPVKSCVEPMLGFIETLKNNRSSFQYIVPQNVSDGQNLFTIEIDYE